jgi:raffinose/stachyose/melibiose transport system permease protein
MRMKITRGPGASTGLPAPAREGSAEDLATTQAVESPARRRSSTGRRSDRVAVTLFITPPLILFALLVVAPITIAAYTSFFKWNGFRTARAEFIGLDNFSRLLHDQVFIGDLGRGFIIIALSLVLQLPMALGLAMLLNQPLRGRSLYRVLFFAPFVLSEVITAVLFKMVFSPSQGLATKLLGWVGLGHLETTWLADPNTVLYWLFFVISWKYFGFHMILYLAGRQNIPKELTEAAATDGATAWQTFRRITLPLLGPTIRISVFLSIIGAIQLFDMVWVLTEGGPIHASETMAVTMFQFGFRRFEVGYASAISIAMFLISLVFALLYQRFVLRRDVEGAVTVMGNRR